MREYKIYCHVFPNGKRYFGQTKRTLEERFGKNGINYKDSPLLWHAIQKYGWENISHILIKDNLTKEEANKYEMAYIKSYKTYDKNHGYNLTLGGDGNNQYDYQNIYDLWLSNLSIKEIAQQLDCSPKTVRIALNSYGISGKERISKSAGKYHSFPIYQYTMNGEFLSSYNSISEAEKITNISHTNIIKVLQNKRRSAGDYRWSKEKVEKLPIYIYQSENKIKVVKQYTLEGLFLKEFSSASQAAIAVTGKPDGGSAIGKVCKGQARTAYGYRWSY